MVGIDDRESGGAVSLSPAEVSAHRHAMGLSLDQMAAMLGVNPRTVRSWESGRDRLSASSAAALLDLVGRHVELVGRMVSAGVPVVVPREVPVDAVPPRGWFLAAAGAALRVEPDLMVDWG